MSDRSFEDASRVHGSGDSQSGLESVGENHNMGAVPGIEPGTSRISMNGRKICDEAEAAANAELMVKIERVSKMVAGRTISLQDLIDFYYLVNKDNASEIEEMGKRIVVRKLAKCYSIPLTQVESCFEKSNCSAALAQLLELWDGIADQKLDPMDEKVRFSGPMSVVDTAKTQVDGNASVRSNSIVGQDDGVKAPKLAHDEIDRSVGSTKSSSKLTSNNSAGSSKIVIKNVLTQAQVNDRFPMCDSRHSIGYFLWKKQILLLLSNECYDEIDKFEVVKSRLSGSDLQSVRLIDSGVGVEELFKRLDIVHMASAKRDLKSSLLNFDRYPGEKTRECVQRFLEYLKIITVLPVKQKYVDEAKSQLLSIILDLNYMLCKEFEKSLETRSLEVSLNWLEQSLQEKDYDLVSKSRHLNSSIQVSNAELKRTRPTTVFKQEPQVRQAHKPHVGGQSTPHTRQPGRPTPYSGCYRCWREGHKARLCRVWYNVLKNCQICNGHGHTTENCLQEGRVTCGICQSGHQLSVCPNHEMNKIMREWGESHNGEVPDEDPRPSVPTTPREPIMTRSRTAQRANETTQRVNETVQMVCDNVTLPNMSSVS